MDVTDYSKLNDAITVLNNVENTLRQVIDRDVKFKAFTHLCDGLLVDSSRVVVGNDYLYMSDGSISLRVFNISELNSKYINEVNLRRNSKFSIKWDNTAKSMLDVHNIEIRNFGSNVTIGSLITNFTFRASSIGMFGLMSLCDFIGSDWKCCLTNNSSVVYVDVDLEELYEYERWEL